MLLVTHHALYGPCIVVFHNSERLEWECPHGKFEPKHHNVVVTAAAELFEETCGLVDIEPLVLSGFARRGPANSTHSQFHDGVFAIRVDNLSRDVFYSNRAAIQGLATKHKNKKKLTPCLEMDGMRFVPLAELEKVKQKQYGVCEVADVDGKITPLGLLKKQLQAGGLELVRLAYASGDVASQYPSTQFLHPSLPLSNGQCTLYGVRARTVRAYAIQVRQSVSTH